MGKLVAKDGLSSFKPWGPMFLMLADDGPEREVHGLVDGVIERLKRGGDGVGTRPLSEATDGPEPDAAVLVVDGLLDDVSDAGDFGMAMIDDPKSGGPVARIFGREEGFDEVDRCVVESLVSPHDLHTRKVFGEPPFPAVEGCENFIAIAGAQFAAGLLAMDALFRKEVDHEVLDGRLGEVFLFDKGLVFEGDPPDASARVVAAFVTEVDFAVLNDGVVPVGNIKCTVGSHFHIDGSEGAVGRTQEVIDAGRFVRGSFGSEFVGVNAMATEVGRDEDVTIFFRNVGAGENLEAAKFGLSGVEAVNDPLGARRGSEDGAGEDVVDSVTTGAIGGKGLAVFVEDKSPGIDEALGEDFRALGFGAEMPNTTSHEPAHAIRSFEVAVDVN